MADATEDAKCARVVLVRASLNIESVDISVRKKERGRGGGVWRERKRHKETTIGSWWCGCERRENLGPWRFLVSLFLSLLVDRQGTQS